MYHVSIELQSTCAYVQKVLSQVHVCRGTKREGEGRERERERGGGRQTDRHTHTDRGREVVCINLGGLLLGRRLLVVGR